MAKEIAVNGSTLKHGSGSSASGGTFTITSTPSIKSKIKHLGIKQGMYKNPLVFTFIGGNGTGAVNGSVYGGGSISATSLKVTAEGLSVMRKGDSLTTSFTGVTPPPASAPIAVVAIIEIDDPGQSVAKSE